MQRQYAYRLNLISVRLLQPVCDTTASAFGFKTWDEYLAALEEEGPAIMKRLQKPEVV